MKLRFARSLVLVAGLTALPPLALAIPPQTPRTNPLAGPQKAVHDAQVNLETAKKQLLVIRKRVELSFESKPEWKAAKDAMEKSKLEYETEVRKVNASMEKDPEYKALVVKRDKAQAVIDASHAPAVTNSGDDPVKLTDDQIATAVKDHQDAVLAIRDMQKRAESNDPNFTTIRQKQADARTAWDNLQAQVDEQVKTDPGYQPAQLAVDQAEQSLKSAREQLSQASKSLRDQEAAAAKARSNPSR